MKALAVIVPLLAACAPGERPRDRQPVTANPSAVVAAELAFARAARERGQWTAFRQTALPQAEMFAPRRTLARDFLKGRADPPTAVAWQPHFVAISCDGTAAVSTGASQWPDGRAGYFTTIWLRQGDGWKWVLDHGDFLVKPRPAPDAVATRIADCGQRPPLPVTAPAVGVDYKLGASRDQTLIWRSVVNADGSRRVSAEIWNDGRWEIVVEDVVGPGG